MILERLVSGVRTGALALLLTGVSSLPMLAETVSIGTTAQGSQGAAMGVALARLLNADDLNVRAVPLGGPEVSLPLLERGEVQFAIVSADAASLAAAGESVFSGRKTETTRMAAHLLPFSLGWFVRADSEYRSISDLKGARVPWGFAQQQILGLWAEAQLAASGVASNQVERVMTTSVPNSVQDFMAGRVDAALFTIGSGLVSQADASVGGIRYLSLPRDGNAEDVIVEMVPGTTVATVEPADNRPGVLEPVDVMQSTLVLLTQAEVDPALVERVVTAIYSGKEELTGIMPAFSSFEPGAMYEPVANLDYHPGAITFYENSAVKAE